VSWTNRHKLRKRTLLNSKYQGHGQQLKRRGNGLQRTMPSKIIGRGSKVKKPPQGKNPPSGINVISRRVIARKPAISATYKLAQLANKLTSVPNTPEKPKLASAVDVFTFANNLSRMFHWE
jgi:hypothetical protein